MINSEINLSSASIQTDFSKDSFDSTFNKLNNIIVDKLIAVIIKKHDEGYTFNQIQQLINQKILKLNQFTNNLINWLKDNKDISQYSWFLGLFYYYNIGVKGDNAKAFELFSKPADENYSIAQVYLVKCYSILMDMEQDKIEI